ncbi:transglutaminase 5, like [Cheilinus undulatus]|uniref:transglutaminase 5, like n=1 Tax=Cheilinus undulatus TaxID=241271 RepID=UPI001BD3B7B0|nr:transglutaminase 5, like [Cheilinus undulatus]
MEDFTIKHVSLERSDNMERHRTEDFSSSNALVVRRGAPFRVTLQLEGRPLNPKTDNIRIKVMIGRLYAIMPVTLTKKVSPTHWKAFMDPESLDLMNPSIFISSPVSSSVGCYRFQLCVFTQDRQKKRAVGRFILLCNPWCREDEVYIPFEDQREEYILNDSGLLFMGTPMNMVARPWSFDQYEPGVLEACLNLLQVSPQHQKNRRMDYVNRNNPVYISRVVSAMINCEDDRGVLKGKWSGNFKDGVNPSSWTGSGDILRQWVESGYSPVKYGQCWVFAAVMCTVMRVLGIPCRVVTNFNSAHDTNDNLVIEEFYSECGKKLNRSRDSIWNFHVWVECWMSRKDLGSGVDGWQVLDPTPQERSGGVFCCGPAPVKAIKDRSIELPFDVPFVYAEVNADVHMIVLRGDKVLSVSKDTERVGSFICTKAVGYPRQQNITGDYKHVRSPSSTLSSRSSNMSGDSTSSCMKDVFVFLTLDKAPVAGEPVRFTVRVINKLNAPKMLKVHLNAQAKEYNNSPLDSFWENHGVIKMGPMEEKVLRQQIVPAEYEDVVGDNLINLAVVLEDMEGMGRVLATEEFNIASPEINIEIADEDRIIPNKQQTATVTFTNPFSHPVSGVLTITGAGLIQGKLHYRMPPLCPGGAVEQRITFIPSKVGTKMLQASLSFSNMNSTIRGYKIVSVQRA